MNLTETSIGVSVSPLTGSEYEIPTELNQQKEIDAFLDRNAGKKVVAVQGLGFVGSVMSLVVANALTEEYAVIGVDLPTKNTYWKICSINEGLFPVIADDPKIELFYTKSREKGNFLASYDSYAFSRADVIVVDINLDVQKKSTAEGHLEDFTVNLTPFKKAMASIGKNCKEDVLILVETTVPPGTCEKIVKPIIQECLQDRGLSTDKLKIGHSYERVMPGPKYVDSIQNFYRVFSGIDEKSAVATEQFLKTIIRTDEYPLTRLGNTNATEMAKVLENSFRAMNIAFMAEWSRFAEESGVNLYEVVSAIRMRPTHKNIMLPGLGVGGYCLTKDPLLASWSKQNLFDSYEGLAQSEAGVRINDRMPREAFYFLKKQYKQGLQEKNALLLGVSYLNDVGDTRFTPVEPLYDELIASGCNIKLHDPHVVYWEEKDIRINKHVDELLTEELDIIIFTTGHRQYREATFMQKLLELPELFVLDTIGLLTDDQIKLLLTKHTVKVIGRGDI